MSEEKTRVRETLDRLSEKTGQFLNRLRENTLARVRSSVAAPGMGGGGTGFQTMDATTFVEWAGRAARTRGTSFYIRLVTILLCTFFFADLTALLAGRFIPEPPMVRSTRGFSRKTTTIEDYNIIFTRNLFNRKGLIPGEETQGTPDLGGAPIRTSLPFNLVGTVILRDELRSIATIEDKSANMVYPVRVEDEIPQKARIVKVEPRKVTFVNLSTGRREFVDLPEETLGIAPRIGGGPTLGVTGSGIEQTSATQYNVSRQEVDRALGDLNNLLTQARAVPNFKNGQPAGYKIFQIAPGSLFEKLGIRNGDAIVGVDGAPLSDPGQAFSMLNSLKEKSHLDLQIERDGKVMPFSYDIH